MYKHTYILEPDTEHTGSGYLLEPDIWSQIPPVFQAEIIDGSPSDWEPEEELAPHPHICATDNGELVSERSA